MTTSSTSASFSTFSFDPRIADAIVRAGYTEPTPIQQQAIAPVLAGKDLMALAQTGSGKTAAFVLPIAQRLGGHRSGGARALIVVPTRELADQVHEVVRQFASVLGLRSATVFGGVSEWPQVRKMREGVDIIVACPGRLVDLHERGVAPLDKVEILVLDEADRMFDMGFLPPIRKIVAAIPKPRQSLLFSATMPEEIRSLAMNILSSPVTVRAGQESVTTISHSLYTVPQQSKEALLFKLLKETAAQSVLVFTRTKHRAKRLAERLERAGQMVTCLQGNLSQNRRKEAMQGFREGRYQVLVATDIVARGIDIASISHVINFDMPDTVEAYTHRIGRTGRASREGDAITFVSPEDEGMVRDIERALKARIPRLKADLPHVAEEPRRQTVQGDEHRGSFGGRRPQQHRRSGGGGRPHHRGGQRRGNEHRARGSRSR